MTSVTILCTLMTVYVCVYISAPAAQVFFFFKKIFWKLVYTYTHTYYRKVEFKISPDTTLVSNYCINHLRYCTSYICERVHFSNNKGSPFLLLQIFLDIYRVFTVSELSLSMCECPNCHTYSTSLNISCSCA